MNEKEVMMLIRRNPEKAFQEYGFVINAERTSGNMEGQELMLSVRRIDRTEDGDEIFEMELGRGSERCFYFPYISSGLGGVGYVVVPKDVPVGTVVLSGAMNGCALQVNLSEDGGKLIFMHDADGIALADHAKAAVFLEKLNRSEAVLTGLGNRLLCRVTASDYLGKKTAGSRIGLSYDMLTRGKNYCYFRYTPFFVKITESQWKLYMSPTGEKEDHTMGRIRGTKYPDIYCITHFDA